MDINIRKYSEEKDYQTLRSWWIEQNLFPCWKALLPEDTTFILEINDVPVLSACLYLMNCKDACMVENLIGNPKYKNEARKAALPILFEYLENIAKKKGYTTLVLFSYENKLKQRYEDLGFIKTLENVTTFAKLLN